MVLLIVNSESNERSTVIQLIRNSILNLFLVCTCDHNCLIGVNVMKTFEPKLDLIPFSHQNYLPYEFDCSISFVFKINLSNYLK